MTARKTGRLLSLVVYYPTDLQSRAQAVESSSRGLSMLKPAGQPGQGDGAVSLHKNVVASFDAGASTSRMPHRPVVIGNSARHKIREGLLFLVFLALWAPNVLVPISNALPFGNGIVGWTVFGIIGLLLLYFHINACWHAMVLRGTVVSVRTVLPFTRGRRLDLTQAAFWLSVAAVQVTDVPSMLADKTEPVLKITAGGKTLKLTLQRRLAPGKLLALAAAIGDPSWSPDRDAVQLSALLRQWAEQSAQVRST